MNTQNTKTEPHLETKTLIEFRAEIAREFGLRKKVRGDQNKNWWKRKPEDVALVELGQWVSQMLKEGNGVGRKKKDVDKYLKEVEREQAMRGKWYPSWVSQGRFTKSQSVEWIAVWHEIKMYLKSYNDFYFNTQMKLEL